MKKWIIVLLVLIGLYVVGCAADEEVSSLNEYDMVYMEEKNDCQDFVQNEVQQSLVILVCMLSDIWKHMFN